MANNRMYLLHRPTGEHVYLGKRMAVGWYDVPQDIRERMVKLFELIEDKSHPAEQDDFVVLLEDTSLAPACMQIDDPTVNMKRDIIHAAEKV